MKRLPLLVFGGALLVHVLAAATFELPGTFRKYTLAAEQDLAGELPRERLTDFSPLYLELARTVTRLTSSNDAVLHGLQLVLVAAAAGFLAALLRPRFGVGTTVVAVAVFVLDRHVLVYGRILEPEVCLVFFLLGWLFFLERRGGFVAGLFAAAALATRPTFLPVALLVPLAWRLRDKDGWPRRSASFLVPVIVVLVLLMVRAAAVTGDPTAPVMNPGTVLYEGNNALSHGTSAVYPPLVLDLMEEGEVRPDAAHQHYRDVARAEAGEDLGVAEVNAWWSGLALRTLTTWPGRSLGLLREKLLHAFHGYRWHDVSVAWAYDRRLPPVSLPFSILASLALLGLLAELERLRTAFVFYLVTAAQVGVMVVFYVSARQRLVLLPLLVYFAAAAAATLRGLWRDGQRPRALLWGAVGALLTLVLALPDAPMLDEHHFRASQEIAAARRTELYAAIQGEPVAAHRDLALETRRYVPWAGWLPTYYPQDEVPFAAQLAERLAEDPWPGVPAAFDRGVAFLEAGRWDEAEDVFRELAETGVEVYRRAHQPSEPLFYLGRIAALRGDRPGALRLLGEALERSPGDPWTLAELVVLGGGDDPRRTLTLTRGRLGTEYLVGRALRVHGRAAEAAEALGWVVERLPRHRRARIYLAAALGAAGRLDEGVEQYLAARELAEDPLYLSVEIADLFRRWGALHSEDPEARLLAARLLHEHGYPHDALTLLEGTAPPSEREAAFAAETAAVRRTLAALQAD